MLCFVFQSYPGKFLLSYLPRTRCRHEYVTISPDGYRFRGQMFNRVNDLFRWFKEHFRDPIPGQITPGTPHGATTSRTPYNGTPGVNGNVYNITRDIDTPNNA